MTLPAKCKRLSVYVGGHYQINGLPLHEAIVMQAKKDGLAGVTVFTGLMSFGHLKMLEGGRLQGDKLSGDLPVMVQLIEAPEKIAAFLPFVQETLGKRGLVTLEDIDILHQGGA